MNALRRLSQQEGEHRCWVQLPFNFIRRAIGIVHVRDKHHLFKPLYMRMGPHEAASKDFYKAHGESIAGDVFLFKRGMRLDSLLFCSYAETERRLKRGCLRMIEEEEEIESQ